MGASIRPCESSKYGDAASESEFREWQHDEHADYKRARDFGADERGYVQRECVVEYGRAFGLDYCGYDGERGRGSDKPDCGIEQEQ